MSKAILVIDMPSNCYQCPFYTRECANEYLDEYEDGCMFSDEDITGEYLFERPNWCPLKEVPEKYDIEDALKKQHDRDWTGEFESGYNTCIDEILGE